MAGQAIPNRTPVSPFARHKTSGRWRWGMLVSVPWNSPPCLMRVERTGIIPNFNHQSYVVFIGLPGGPDPGTRHFIKNNTEQVQSSNDNQLRFSPGEQQDYNGRPWHPTKTVTANSNGTLIIFGRLPAGHLLQSHTTSSLGLLLVSHHHGP